MLRKLNFTERSKIPRAAFSVGLRRDPDGALAFDTYIAPAELDAPPTARVYVEAYHGTSFMRFDCGTVSELSLPSDRRLHELASTTVRFRLKIVDPSDHRVLAVADDIRVTEKAPDAGNRSPLLPVQFSETLGQVAWRLDFEPDSVVLSLNGLIPGIEKLAKEDPLFFALVYPAAVREILTRILLVERQPANEIADEWWSHWISWARRYNSEPLPSDDEAERQNWIEGVVNGFCDDHKTLDRIVAAKEDQR